MFAVQATALEFGPAPQGIALGRPLVFSVPVRIDPGETVPPECVVADVTLGEEHIPRPLLRARLDRVDGNTTVVRVTSNQLITEPVVQIEIGIGCPTRLTRRFLVLADPPSETVASATPVALPVPEAVRDAPLVAATLPAPPNPAPDSARPPPPTTRPQPVPRPTAASAPAARAPQPQASGPAPAPRLAASENRPRPRVADAGAAQEKSRLQVDVVTPNVREARPLAQIVQEAIQAIEAVTQTAGSASAAASAASTASDRIAALEKTVTALHKDSQAQRDLMLQMQAELMAAQTARSWLMPLVLLVLALAGLTGWLAWRLRQVQGDRRPAQTPATPESVMAQAVSDDVVSRPPNFDSTAPPNSVLPTTSPRDVSIEELIDLEQQADFFIALGQEESAVELLTDHLRNTGGGGPLAYLKLLEIYKRRDDRGAYERIRQGFNKRFNAYAPVWEADLQGGLDLEDYTEVLENLQLAWKQPSTAIEELSPQIFHSAEGDVFDLPAYREVLFLYALALDLADHAGQTVTPIDLMAPLYEVPEMEERSDRREFQGTAPQIDAEFERFTLIEPVEEGTPTALVDLDVYLDLDLNTDPELNLDLDLTDPPHPERKARGH